jgi:CBS domain-containing protein
VSRESLAEDVALLVRDFMTRNPRTVYFDSTVAKAIDAMAEHDIGSVVVIDNSGPIGIFTERDLLSKVLASDEPLEYQMIVEVMSRSLVEISPDQTFEQAVKKMNAKKDRLVAFEDGDLIGVITATDLVRTMYKLGKNFDISNFISKNVTTVHANTDVDLVIQKMDEARIGSVVVGRDNDVLGIFTERDLLKKVLAPKINLNAPIGEFISKPLIAAKFGIDGREASHIMVKNNIKRLPILKDGKLIGIITARDLVQAFGAVLHEQLLELATSHAL